MSWTHFLSYKPILRVCSMLVTLCFCAAIGVLGGV